MPGNWLSSSEIAKLLGVHPSTVRNWADQGVLPVHRTQGGHRRFMRSEVDLWIQSQRVTTEEDTNGMFRNALGYARIQIVEGHLESESWYKKMNDEARNAYRRSGRTLMQGLMKSQAVDDESAKNEARALGVDYASIGRRHGLTILEATEAFLFFRNVLIDSSFHVYEQAAIHSPQAWGEMFRTINDFSDNILLTLIETYQAFERGNKGKE
ncbi:MAG: helix-turn-helix domain-containing protein [Chloroflexi bacterium]|jgi:excisionase family DNA binding protein|nr:helix-turn-helix domain-containing protein [Chloroflexota bacterium]MBT6358500.1 helix-turn-helix domain-containing protein [Chloroflexota bacterium]